MTSIQPLLIVLLSLALILIWRSARSALLSRFLLFTIYLVGILLVLRPEAADVIAHALGVGRGTDLLLYFLIIAIVYGSLLVYRKIKLLEDRQTELIRQIALANARPPHAPQ